MTSQPRRSSPPSASPGSTRGRRLRRAVGVALASTVALAGGIASAQAVEATVPVASNPAMPDRCDLDLAISLDLSNSVADAQLEQAKAALTALAEDLQGYPVRLALHNFASDAPATADASNQALPLTALDAEGISLISSHVADLQRPASGAGGTNWDRAFAAVTSAPETYDALLLVTDGNPTQYGSPAQGPGSSTDVATINAAVTSANALKAAGTRVIPIGVNDNVTGAGLVEFRENISQVSGTVEGSDYYVGGFDALRQTLVQIVNQNCAEIDLQKSAQLAAGAYGYAGDTVEYSFAVTNTGAVTLGSVTLVDQLPGLSEITFGQWPAAAGVLAPGESVSATATYVLTSEDIARGYVENTASVTGTPPAGDPVADDDDETVPVNPSSSISLTKTGALNEGATGAAGDLVSYQFTVTNTGAVPLTSVSLTDEMPGLSEIEFGSWPSQPGTLAPGESVNATATYVLTATDVDAGLVDNIASVTGNPPSGPPVEDEDEHEQPLPQTPSIELVKTAALAADATGRVGDIVTYSFLVTNAGNVTLRDVTVTDQLPGLSAIVFGPWPAQQGVLAAGESVTATATYSLTQADVDAGRVDNTATTTGTPPQGPSVSDEDDETVTISPTPAIELVKTGSLAAGAAGVAGDRIEYAFTVTNVGNTTLTGVTIADELPGLSEIVFSQWPAQAGVLAPGESVEARATYALTQADVDAGVVNNHATSTGTPPSGPPVQDEDEDEQPLPQLPQLTLVKSGSLAEGSTGVAGDLVEYTFEITNVGNVTLTAVDLTDELPGLSAITFGEWPSLERVLAPEESVVATATYTLTQADVDAGQVDNTASATGTPPSGPPVNDEDDETVPVPQGPRIDLIKTGALEQGAASGVGDQIRYSFTITNAGNVTLSGVELHDSLPGLSQIVFDAWPAEAGVLAPAESVTASATYTLTQADVDAGQVHNTATTTGNPPSGPPVDDEDEHEQPVPHVPAIDLVKTGALEAGAAGTAGDLVIYTFLVTNTGNVTLDGIVLTDELPGLSAITFGEWPGAAGSLASGESVSATATYPLTQADVDAARVDNTATVTGLPPQGDPVSDVDDETVPVEAVSAIQIVKTGGLGSDATGKVGDLVTFTFTVTNTGSTTLRDVVITDELPGLTAITYGQWPLSPGTLAPGESVVATATYALTKEDINAGEVNNTATVTAVPPQGPNVTDDDTTRVEITPTPSPKATEPLPSTGAANTMGLALVALTALALGGTALRVRKARA